MNRTFKLFLGMALVAVLVFGGAGAAMAKGKPHKPDPGAKVVARYTKQATLVTALGLMSGVPTADIRAALKPKGATLASVATSYGVDPQSVVDTAVAQVKVDLDKLVESHRLKVKHETGLLAHARARFEFLMFFPKHHPGIGDWNSMRFATTSSLVRNLAQLASVPTSEVASARRQGRSLASIAESLGVDPAAVVAASQAHLKTRLDKLVASHRITQAQEDAILTRSRNRLTRLMNFVPPAWCKPVAPIVPAV